MKYILLALGLALLALCALHVLNACKFRRIRKLFTEGNTCTYGLRGRGKDMLMSNVVARRKVPYISNVDYKCISAYHPYEYACLDVGNDYPAFNQEVPIKPYVYPYEDGTDIYLSDCGVHFPSQHQAELVKKYRGLSTFVCLSRHLGACNMHINAQSLNRIWDKLREQCDIYINVRGCTVLLGGRIVIQRLRVYETYQAASTCAPPFRLRRPFFDKTARMMWALEKQRYEQSNGKIKTYTIIYRNKSQYDTRFFKTLLKGNL